MKRVIMPSSAYTDVIVTVISGWNEQICRCRVVGQRLVFADKNKMWWGCATQWLRIKRWGNGTFRFESPVSGGVLWHCNNLRWGNTLNEIGCEAVAFLVSYYSWTTYSIKSIFTFTLTMLVVYRSEIGCEALAFLASYYSWTTYFIKSIFTFALTMLVVYRILS